MNETKQNILLEAQGINRIYYQGKEELRVLKDINLKIEKSQITSIVGPSGAGKSTLMHILGGLDRPDKGRVFFNGRDIYELSDNKLSRLRNQKIGFVFQFYHLLPEFSALENVILPGLIARKKKQELEKKGLGLLRDV
ncbi:MAG: ATP-binding cassette domain-containing protein, partial [Candidatus Omnitrophica bacterium]|nr:ATP-binding cassette domain-containing protein [Candidatus Omnitrophota bacterium]